LKQREEKEKKRREPDSKQREEKEKKRRDRRRMTMKSILLPKKSRNECEQ